MLGTNFDTSINGSPIDTTTVTIPAGSLTGQVTLIGKLDGAYGPDLPLTVGIAAVVNGVAGGSSVAVTIQENGAKPIVTLSPNTSTMAEVGGSTTITATQNEISGVDTTLVIVYGGTAALGTDFTVSGNNYTAATASLVIPAGQLSASLTLTGLNKPTFGSEPDGDRVRSVRHQRSHSRKPELDGNNHRGKPGTGRDPLRERQSDA